MYPSLAVPHVVLYRSDQYDCLLLNPDGDNLDPQYWQLWGYDSRYDTIPPYYAGYFRQYHEDNVSTAGYVYGRGGDQPHGGSYGGCPSPRS